MTKPRYQKKQSGYYDKASKALSIAGKALAVGVATKKLLNVEKKYLDKEFNQNVSEDVATINLLNGVAQGDTGITRDGDQAKFLSLQWRGMILGPTGSDGPSAVRIMIVHDKQGDGATPTITEILEQAEWQSPLNMANKMRFSVLHDSQYTVGLRETVTHTNNGSIPSIKLVKGYLKLGKKDMGIKVRYNGTGSAITDLSSNPIWLVQIASGADGLNASKTDLYFRLRFVDN